GQLGVLRQESVRQSRAADTQLIGPLGVPGRGSARPVDFELERVFASWADLRDRQVAERPVFVTEQDGRAVLGRYRSGTRRTRGLGGEGLNRPGRLPPDRNEGLQVSHYGDDPLPGDVARQVHPM